ncbi:hypothetical protein VB1_CDS0068 [Arthrobacter phage Marchesin]|nr:hypothetical protein VB1_CDS0068 [Arthrobacter phage Marchesin]
MRARIGRWLCGAGWHKWALWLGHSAFNVRWVWACRRCGARLEGER